MMILGQLIKVPVIMACALGGTVGLLKIIKKVSPDGEFPKDPISRKLEENSLTGQPQEKKEADQK